jgi:hypothetical protein
MAMLRSVCVKMESGATVGYYANCRADSVC